MLTRAPLTAVLPVRDLERARRFYEEKLGLRPRGRAPDGAFLVEAAGGAVISLAPWPDATPSHHTVLSFEVEDVPASVRRLEAAGVAFEEYDLPGLKTVDKVCVLGSERAAWFKDPEGNVLCVHETLR